eukprot:7925289-Pyramimonas_sp.AAC.1
MARCLNRSKALGWSMAPVCSALSVYLRRGAGRDRTAASRLLVSTEFSRSTAAPPRLVSAE